VHATAVAEGEVPQVTTAFSSATSHSEQVVLSAFVYRALFEETAEV
jgi:hypothetical protein